ncbi:MAG: PAS domain-containing sensor histidine kinase [Ignavibacteria bacterium]|jgi:PAS domain S-box-containing protein|nr:PAS domain-containing sensor histidine kinase [Ignavibacteria bacterium]MCU7502569.1 PAS domain-containing sensor histidine kinase [Ignavibacteria bacterium]MCU7515228.1 PAS domain-containing sensor histidine kinase [Ignavibacteria bacterium]
MLRKILLVENYASSGNGLQHFLEELGYEVYPALLSDKSDIEKTDNDPKDLIFSCVTEDCRREFVAFSEELATRLDVPVIYYYERKNGKDIFSTTSVEPQRIILAPLRVEQLSSTIDKVCAQHKKTGQKIPAQSEKYAAFDCLGFGAIATDTEGRVIFINSAASRITGYTHQEANGRPLKEILKLSSIPDKANSLIAAIQGQISLNSSGYAVITSHEGVFKTIEYNFDPIGGLSSGAVFTFKDVTEKLRKEKEVSLRFEFAIQHSHDIIFMTGRDYVIGYVNPQFEKFYGYSKNEVIGQSANLLRSGMLPEEFYRNFEENLLSGKNINEELVNKTKSGDFVTVEESTSPIYDWDNKIAGYITIQRDITEKKQSEELLRRAYDKAEESDKLKTAFLNQMSHEIRTPLNSILGFMSLMEEELVNKGIGDLVMYFNSINRSSMRLQRTIEDILAMSSIQIGNYYTSLTKINLENVLQLLMKDFSSLAAEKKLGLSLENKARDAIIDGDSYTIVQSFQHLIDNALKFTQKGEVKVTIYESDGLTCADITDTGIGISKEYMEKLFKPFSQEEIGYNRRYDGNGLGLAITKEYLRMNHADVYVQSEKGKGSKFTVVFFGAGSLEEEPG